MLHNRQKSLLNHHLYPGASSLVVLADYLSGAGFREIKQTFTWGCHPEKCTVNKPIEFMYVVGSSRLQADLLVFSGDPWPQLIDEVRGRGSDHRRPSGNQPLPIRQ